jgi:ATP-dependent RNA helicase DDX42
MNDPRKTTMGFFDDSSDEEPAAQKQPLDSHGDDEDPLDAYMKTLDQQERVDSSAKRPQPLDKFDNDEEDRGGGSSEDIGSGNLSSGDNYVDDDSQKAAAKQALENTFRKAGGAMRTEFAAALPEQSKPSTLPFKKCFWEGSDTAMGRNWRRDHQVVLSTSLNGGRRSTAKTGIGLRHSNSEEKTSTIAAAMDPILQFEELEKVFGAGLMKEIRAQSFTKPTLVQSQTLPIAMKGNDALVTASTGQGKTLAYVWPMIVHVAHQTPLQIEPLETGPMALVLVPTRELALQVHKQAKPMLAAAATTLNGTHGRSLTCRAVIGGQGKYLLRQELKKAGVEVVVATPGRLLDVVSDRKGLSLQRVTFLVLDEADKMLQMGFEAQVRQILQQIRPDRQTLMLSATMGLRVEKVAQEWLSPDHTVRISVGRTGEASQNVEQHVMVLPTEEAKETFLLEMLPVLSQVGRTVVFVATREKCERLAILVREHAPTTTVLTLHGDKHQADRTAAVRAFTKGEVKVLIATDVAARGLDIPNIQTVLSFDPAKNLDSHVHRVGRAGRLSKETNEQQLGSAYTLLTTKNADFAHILRGAFEREDRIVSPELLELSQRSRRRTNGSAADTSSRTKVNKAGLGFVPPSAVGEGNLSHPARTFVGTMMNGSGHSGDTAAPPAKRGRWS